MPGFSYLCLQVKRENGKVRKRPVIRPTAGSMRREPGAGQAPRSPGSAERIHICRTECTPPPDDQLHAGAAIRRRHAVGRHRRARRIGRADPRPRNRAHGGVRTAAAGGFRRRDHAARRQVVPAHVAIEQSLCLRPGNRQENQGVPLSRRRLGTDHRRAEALHVGRHGQYLHARPCDLQTRETHDGDAQRHSDQFPQRTGVDRRQVVGQRLHDRPDRHYRPGDGRGRRGRRPHGTVARRGGYAHDRRTERHRIRCRRGSASS